MADSETCAHCGQANWWERPKHQRGGMVCAVCHPDPEELHDDWYVACRAKNPHIALFSCSCVCTRPIDHEGFHGHSPGLYTHLWTTP